MRTSLSNNIALDLPSPTTAFDDPTAVLPTLSPRLHNKDLAPTKAEGRRWGRYSIFALWTNDVHNIANYSLPSACTHWAWAAGRSSCPWESARRWCMAS